MAGRTTANDDTKKNETIKTQENKESKSTEIDIQAIIKQAVYEATKASISTIEDLKKKNEELENKIGDLNNVPYLSPKKVEIMYMGVGSANFSKGRINVDFEKPFDVKTVRYDIFEEMYDLYGEWFKNFELVVLDKSVRETMGLEYTFKEFGADKSTFEEILKLGNVECMGRLKKLKPMVAMTFLKYYIDEYLNGNTKTITKFADITDFYKVHYGIDEIQNAITDMTNNK